MTASNDDYVDFTAEGCGYVLGTSFELTPAGREALASEAVQAYTIDDLGMIRGLVVSHSSASPPRVLIRRGDYLVRDDGGDAHEPYHPNPHDSFDFGRGE